MSKTWQIVIVTVLVLVVLTLCCIASYLVVKSLTGGKTTPTPTVAPSADDSWDRVQAAGKIVVGTSADYPPFEYMVNDSQIDGFDIALMDEIGRQLGIQVEYRNMAFDGLIGALQVGQVDAVIAAMSATPEREAYVDFTNVYFVGQDGILAKQDSPIGAISSVGQLADYVIGVQRASVYESWMQSSLVDTGQMPADNLKSYEAAGDAVRDLEQGRVELVVLDLQPAEAAVKKGGVKLVGQSLNQQHYALAVPKGAAALKAQLDGTLVALNNDGTIARLAKLYLNQGLLLPTPTPAATSTPGPVPACVDALALIAHPGQEGDPVANPPQMAPGQPFTKVWRVKNTGTCTWDSAYQLVYANGNKPASRMDGQPVAIQGQVPPGQQYDLAVNLVSPPELGTYVGYWQMENGKGEAFGERLPVAVEVIDVPTPTAGPVPTQTPTTGIFFTVDRTDIKAGECVVFSWKVENARAVYFYADGERWQDNGVAGEARQQECPPQTTTYYLRVVKLDNSVETQQITINVATSPGAPVINEFTVDPAGQIPLGDCVDLDWDVSGDVDQVTITANAAILWDNAPLQGTVQDCPAKPGTVTYAIRAEGPGGQSQRQQTIDVVSSATVTPEPSATPEPTVAPEQPVIDAFSATPDQVEVGDCVNISWSTSGGTTWVTIVKNDDALQDNAPLSGSTQDCPTDEGSVVYGVVAYNAEDQSVKDSTTVTVSGGAPTNPLAGTSWTATAYYVPISDTMATVLPGTGLTATFADGGDLSGSSGCNSFSGTYQVDGSSLRISALSVTNQLCTQPEGVMEQEDAYLADLTSASGFSLEGGQLYMLDSSGRAIIESVRRDR